MSTLVIILSDYRVKLGNEGKCQFSVVKCEKAVQFLSIVNKINAMRYINVQHGQFVIMNFSICFALLLPFLLLKSITFITLKLFTDNLYTFMFYIQEV